MQLGVTMVERSSDDYPSERRPRSYNRGYRFGPDPRGGRIREEV